MDATSKMHQLYQSFVRLSYDAVPFRKKAETEHLIDIVRNNLDQLALCHGKISFYSQHDHHVFELKRRRKQLLTIIDKDIQILADYLTK